MSAQEYEWLNDANIVVLRATPNPDIVGGFTLWTQDATTKAVTVTLTGLPDSVPLAFKPPTGATANATDQIEVYDDAGNLLFFVDAAGNFRVTPVPGQFSSISFNTSAGNAGLTVDDDGTHVGPNTAVGFFGSDPVARPAVTGALSSVSDAAAKAVLTSLISALDTLGVVSNGTT